MKLIYLIPIFFCLNGFQVKDCKPKDTLSVNKNKVTYVSTEDFFQVLFLKGNIKKVFDYKFECNRNWSQKPRFLWDNESVVVLMRSCGSSCSIYTICNFRDAPFELFKAKFDKKRSLAAYIDKDLKSLIIENLLTRKRQRLQLNDFASCADPMDCIENVDFMKNKIKVSWVSKTTANKTYVKVFVVKV